MASFGIGARLRKERVGRGLEIDDISRDTRIAPRFLEAIETDDYASIPGLVFARSFVRQYALILKLDPDPLLAELPKQDESTVPLPNPPARPRSAYRRERRRRSIITSAVWLVLIGGTSLAAYEHFRHPREITAPPTPPPVAIAKISSPPVAPAPRKKVVEPAAKPSGGISTGTTSAAPVQVSLTAHEAAWVQVSVDGKVTFIGTLQPNETKEVSAAEQVRVLAGNAGALTISWNGKTMESLGPIGQVRLVKLTAGGPQFLSKAPPPAPDPL